MLPRRVWRQRMLPDGPSGLWEVAPGRGANHGSGLPQKSSKRPAARPAAARSGHPPTQQPSRRLLRPPVPEIPAGTLRSAPRRHRAGAANVSECGGKRSATPLFGSVRDDSPPAAGASLKSRNAPLTADRVRSLARPSGGGPLGKRSLPVLRAFR